MLRNVKSTEPAERRGAGGVPWNGAAASRPRAGLLSRWIPADLMPLPSFPVLRRSEESSPDARPTR